MQRLHLFIYALAGIASGYAFGEPLTRSGTADCIIDSVDTKTATTTVVTHWPKGADPKAKHTPFTFSGDWSFTWDDANPGEVSFTGSANLGNHFTITDAGSMGGVTKQVFDDFSHHFDGTATWDVATRTLRYRVKPTERDVGGASTVTQGSKPECVKIKGMFANTGCGAFLETNTELEGLSLEFVFSEDLSSFSGTIIMTHYGGSGITKSRTDLTTLIKGELE